jgi:hypothetical protein
MYVRGRRCVASLDHASAYYTVLAGGVIQGSTGTGPILLRSVLPYCTRAGRRVPAASRRPALGFRFVHMHACSQHDRLGSSAMHPVQKTHARMHVTASISVRWTVSQIPTIDMGELANVFFFSFLCQEYPREYSRTKNKLRSASCVIACGTLPSDESSRKYDRSHKEQLCYIIQIFINFNSILLKDL